jgi:hypothetical protein
VDVFDRRQNGGFGPQVPVVPAPLLPESEALDAWSLANRQLVEERTPRRGERLLDPEREGPLDRLEQQVEPRLMNRRIHEQVDVLGHEDEGDEVEVVPSDGAIHALGKHPLPIIACQQGHPAIARERDLVEVAGFVEAADCLMIGRHVDEPIASNTSGQATTDARQRAGNRLDIQAQTLTPARRTGMGWCWGLVHQWAEAPQHWWASHQCHPSGQGSCQVSRWRVIVASGGPPRFPDFDKTLSDRFGMMYMSEDVLPARSSFPFR